jgi:immunity protein 5 of polymorphic toxin system
VKRQPGALTLSEDDRRVLAVWAADCAERTLSLFEAQAPNDTRPRDAIDGLRAFARGDMRIGRVRALSAQAHAAAREVGDPAAVAATRAAGDAAGVAHMAAHARGVPAYAAMAAGLAAPDDPTAVHDQVRWALSHASPAVRDVLRRLPPPPRPAGMLGALISDMHTAAHRRRMRLVRRSVCPWPRSADCSAWVHEWGRGGKFDEPESLEDRSAVRGGVDLEVAEASVGRQGSPVGHQRAEHPTAPPRTQRAAAPQAGEVAAMVELHPPGGDWRLPGEGDHGRGGRGLARETGQQGAAQGGAVFAEHQVMH